MAGGTPHAELTPASIGSWPADSLERVPSCPVCQSTHRDRLYEGLTDRVFHCAPGQWTLFRCGRCRTAYLDPRPTRGTIGLAYREYFTHEEPSEPETDRTFPWGYLKTGIRNDYLRARLKVNFHPRLPLGKVAAYLFPYRRLRMEWSLRHLSPPEKHSKLLDIGSGNGAFVRFASSLGWNAQGMDPDKEAVGVARKAGLAVSHGGFPRTGFPDAQFDAVTMSHVIEHVHDPLTALREVHRILKPRGRIWIATPNLDGTGHRLFQRHWLGLDPPRHLMIFNASSLALMCERAGFVDIALRRQDPLSLSIFRSSLRILRNEDPLHDEGEALPRAIAWRARWANLKATLVPKTGEELIMIGTKPGERTKTVQEREAVTR